MVIPQTKTFFPMVLTFNLLTQTFTSPDYYQNSSTLTLNILSMALALLNWNSIKNQQQEAFFSQNLMC
jgi:uncharacterized protein YfdQ (DUF2303 family)